MAISKKNRLTIFNKYNGKCGYTGKSLEDDWQIDHITPISHYMYYLFTSDYNDINNLIPTNKIINHYKRDKDLESFRKYMITFNKRLAKLPKKTMIEKTRKRKLYMEKIADYFDITIEKPFDGIFYFEKL